MAKTTTTANANYNSGYTVDVAADRKLRVIYVVVTFHCAVMLAWTAASNYLPHRHFPALETTMAGNGYMPYRLFTKYEGHSLVYAAHISPAMFWSACIPVQFHPEVRRRYPRLHRYLGRAFICTSFLMMAGVAVIIRRKLLWEHYVNKETNEADPWVVHKIPRTDLSYSDVVMVVLAVVFLQTAWNAVACARKKDYFHHQIWVIRYVARSFFCTVLTRHSSNYVPRLTITIP